MPKASAWQALTCRAVAKRRRNAQRRTFNAALLSWMPALPARRGGRKLSELDVERLPRRSLG